MATTTEMVKQLRVLTGAGPLHCKKALDETGGDMAKAQEILREKGLAQAVKKAERKTEEGRVEAYVHTDIHAGSKLGVLIEVNCETDFVALTDEFKALCHDLAMQVAASNPKWVSREVIPADVVEAETKTWREQLVAEKKPEAMFDHILDGKMVKFCQETCLLDQAYIRDEDKTIRQLVAETIARTGENIVVKRFARFAID
jgi:elongation factor Ts